MELLTFEFVLQLWFQRPYIVFYSPTFLCDNEYLSVRISQFMTTFYYRNKATGNTAGCLIFDLYFKKNTYKILDVCFFI